ncbi:MAG: T9SS type A sorting domain-containing protein [Bacteroidia bacterium]
MKRILLFLFLLTGIISLSAQNFHWARTMGGSSNDLARWVANDLSGNTYITGTFSETADFDPGSASFNISSAGMIDIFIAKLDGQGNFLWAKNIGAAGNEEVRSITTDASGNIILTGYFDGTVDFNPGSGSFKLTATGADMFVLKLDGQGNFIWAIKAGGSSSDIGLGIAVDRKKNVYVTGVYFNTVDFDPGPSNAYLTSIGSSDVFISKYDSAGGFLWAKSVGDTGIEWGNAIAVDSVGNVFVTGQFQKAVDFDPGISKHYIATIGFADAFILKLNSSGGFEWAKKIGGTAGGSTGTMGFSIAVNRKGQVYSTGTFIGTIDFDPGTAKSELTSAGLAKDVYVLKLENNGEFAWAKKFGASLEEDVRSVVVDMTGNVYLTGSFQTTLTFGATMLKSNGTLDVFVVAFDDAGNFKWGQNFGGTGVDFGYASSVDAWGNVFTTGTFSGTVDFDPSATILSLATKGATDAFVTKLSPKSVDIKNIAAPHFSICPNPSPGKFTITNNIEISEIELFNSLGQSILKMYPDEKNVVLNVTQYGLYFIKLTVDNSIFTKKIMVE